MTTQEVRNGVQEAQKAEALAAAFSGLGLPAEAVGFLLKLWTAIQFVDDVQDGDPPDREALYTVLLDLPLDPFLAAHRGILAPVLVTQWHKWQAANTVEHDREADARSYGWRAGYYDVVLCVAAICLPRERVEEIATRILRLYGETLADYLKEFDNA